VDPRDGMGLLEKRKISYPVGFEPRPVHHVARSLKRLYVEILQNKPVDFLRVKNGCIASGRNIYSWDMMISLETSCSMNS